MLKYRIQEWDPPSTPQGGLDAPQDATQAQVPPRAAQRVSQC